MDETIAPLGSLVARAIRVALVRRDLKQYQLAKMMGVGQQWLSRRISDHATVALNLDEIEMIAAALDARLSEFLGPDAGIRCDVQSSIAA